MTPCDSVRSSMCAMTTRQLRFAALWRNPITRRRMVDYRTAYILLMRTLVQTNRTMAGVPSAVKTVDSFIRDLGGNGEGLQPLMPAAESRRSALAVRCPGEIALAAEFLQMAIEEADSPYDTEDRQNARAWLLDHSAIYSARLCLEAMGADFDAVCDALKKRWAKVDAGKAEA